MIGIDIENISRFDHWTEEGLKRIFSENEIEYINQFQIPVVFRTGAEILLGTCPEHPARSLNKRCRDGRPCPRIFPFVPKYNYPYAIIEFPSCSSFLSEALQL